MSKPSLTNELMRLHELREKGAITQEEYDEHKAILLADAKKGANAADDDEDEKDRVAPQPAPIYITQTASAAASSSASAAAVAKNGGCLKTILAAIGLLVVLGFILSTCVREDSDTKPTAEASAPVNTMTEEQAQALVASQKKANDAALAELSALWNGLDAELKGRMQGEQAAWEQQRLNSCRDTPYQTAAENEAYQLECSTKIVSARIAIIRNTQEALAPSIREAREKQMDDELNSSLGTLQTTWDSLSPSIQEQLGSDLKTWEAETNTRCSSVVGSAPSPDGELLRKACLKGAVNRKIKELNGYKL